MQRNGRNGRPSPALTLKARRPGDGSADHARIGQGTLIDDDVRLGSGRANGASRPIEIGRDSRIRGGSTIDDRVRIGDRLETGRNVAIGEDTVIGDDAHIDSNTIIGAGCTLGHRVRVQANCYVAAFTTIEDDVTIGPGVGLANDPHPGSVDHACMRGPTIERGAQIGMNATILPFVTIGQRSVVGAGSVVTHAVPAELVVAGNPARVLKSVDQVTCPLDVPLGEYLHPRETNDASDGGPEPAA
ncbi:MAG TPA: DapH/DapD/GlmU-related protein [Candidatus Limnocylindria bacterium]|nr:DapH/DapD/GlmU-related protein [Candidatus Limnocylindria bacterium]